MMIEKTTQVHLKDVQQSTHHNKELAEGMLRVNHLYRSALKVAVTQIEILDEEFASLNDHSPIHHIEYRIKSADSIRQKLERRGSFRKDPFRHPPCRRQNFAQSRPGDHPRTGRSAARAYSRTSRSGKDLSAGFGKRIFGRAVDADPHHQRRRRGNAPFPH